MTPKQIESLRKPLRTLKTSEMTDKEKTLYRELAWREYVNSCLAYDEEHYLLSENGTLSPSLYKWGTANTYYIGTEIPEQRAIEIINEQKETFKHATIHRGVYTDHEGCTYNSVTFNDEE